MNMGEFKFAKKVPQTDANCILKDFAEHYVDKEKLRKLFFHTAYKFINHFAFSSRNKSASSWVTARTHFIYKSKKRSVCEQFASANWN